MQVPGKNYVVGEGGWRLECGPRGGFWVPRGSMEPDLLMRELSHDKYWV